MPYKGLKNQCKGCTQRHPACHDHCQTYNDALAEWHEFTAAARRNKQKAMDLNRFVFDQAIRNLRRKK